MTQPPKEAFDAAREILDLLSERQIAGIVEEYVAQAVAAAVASERADKDDAFTQRAHLVAALARVFPSGTRRTDIPGWDPEWHGCCFIDLPGGQVSYHYHDRDAHLFDRLPPYEKPWDGHDKAAVHARLATVGHFPAGRAP